MALYYVVLKANDSITNKELIPRDLPGLRYVLAVEAENEDAAADLIQKSFDPLADSKDFGEIRSARKTKNGWTFAMPQNELPCFGHCLWSAYFTKVAPHGGWLVALARV